MTSRVASGVTSRRAGPVPEVGGGRAPIADTTKRQTFGIQHETSGERKRKRKEEKEEEEEEEEIRWTEIIKI